MPNYCNGYLSIECPDDVFEQIKNYVKSEESVFDFDKIIPMPDNIYRSYLGLEEEKRYGKDNWYDWSCENWGTKRNACDATLDGHEYYFETAWSPCSPVISALAKRFPEATMRYSYNESGMAFCGIEEYKDGKLIYTLSGDYYEYYLEDDCEEPDFMIPTSIFEHPDIGCKAEKFFPVCEEDNKVGGKLYISNCCDDTWGYEIVALVAYKGKQPSCWW